MKILVVGGTGMIGGHAALYLKSQGHDVTIAGRSRPRPPSGLADLPFLQGDFVARTFTNERLSKLDGIVFAAGNDIRHVPEGQNFDDHVLRVNGEAVPQFAAFAKQAGVRHFIHIGSFYQHVAPHLIETSPYVRSRKMATDGVTALADGTFHALSLDAPFVVGSIPGMILPLFEAYTGYAQGKLGIPPYAPQGGTNFISTQSISEAVASAIERGENGKAYLIGDENLTFTDYFKLFFRAVGNGADIPALDKQHPLLPDSAIFTGRGSTVSYEPDREETALLGYRRNDITRAVREVVAQILASQGV